MACAGRRSWDRRTACGSSGTIRPRCSPTGKSVGPEVQASVVASGMFGECGIAAFSRIRPATSVATRYPCRRREAFHRLRRTHGADRRYTHRRGPRRAGFGAVLGASNDTYSEATWTQGRPTGQAPMRACSRSSKAPWNSWLVAIQPPSMNEHEARYARTIWAGYKDIKTGGNAVATKAREVRVSVMGSA